VSESHITSEHLRARHTPEIAPGQGRDVVRAQYDASGGAVAAANIWTVRDRKIARVEFQPDRDDALEA